MLRIAFDNSYARLPENLFARLAATPVRAPALVRLNRPLAEELGLDPEALASDEGVAALAGNRVPDGAEPLAQAYAGHQFGGFSPQLGDGRALLLGEVVDRHGRRRDLQLKGSGPTPFSRVGDGRAALGPVLREYAVSEAMAALGIPTTRSLAAVTTGEPVARETFLPGAVLTRVAASHVRVGTFQYLAARRDLDGLRALADHVLARHYPNSAGSDAPYRALLAGVVARQADLVARWLLVGFVHGVMNTDNTTVSGETIDYGPCAFLDAYDPAGVFSSIDVQGRYAYGHQPRIMLWNLTRLAETLVPLLAQETGNDEKAAVAVAEEVLSGFAPAFEAAYGAGMRRKLGLLTEQADDMALASRLLATMHQGTADFTLTFRRLADAAADPAADGPVRDLFIDPTAYDAWAVDWRRRLADEPGDPAARRATMRAANPWVIPRNHRIEAAIRAAVDGQDFSPFHTLVDVLASPYAEVPGREAYADPPALDERVLQTFCGT